MDFLLAVGWLVASVVFGYLVTKSVKDHIRTHRETTNEIAELRLIQEAHHRCIFTGQEDDEPDLGFDKLEDDIPRWEQLELAPEDDLPF